MSLPKFNAGNACRRKRDERAKKDAGDEISFRGPLNYYALLQGKHQLHLHQHFMKLFSQFADAISLATTTPALTFPVNFDNSILPIF
jgi:hypothetical protein